MHQRVFPFGIGVEIRIQIEDKVLTDEPFREVAGPAEEDVRSVFTANDNLDLLFVRLVLGAGDFKLDVRMGSFVLVQFAFNKAVVGFVREAMEELDHLHGCSVARCQRADSKRSQGQCQDARQQPHQSFLQRPFCHSCSLHF
ncbi:hypothetical protein SDC9_166757 [bioreactor metagenome]|uniref:Uncharacterized protein n=1 Tax=bioreactor metagenome TaxID=1076179 RepID=A0A645FXW9_9ZZZZ